MVDFDKVKVQSKRVVPLSFKVTAEEKETIISWCDKHHISFSNLARESIKVAMEELDKELSKK